MFDGGRGNDRMTGGRDDDFFAGGRGNDKLHLGGGADVVAFNQGDGVDRLFGERQDGVLSLGGGIRYEDLRFSKHGSDLVLRTGGGDRIVLEDWYRGKQSVVTLQVVAEAMAGSARTRAIRCATTRSRPSTSASWCRRTTTPARAERNLQGWKLMNELLDAHLGGSDTRGATAATRLPLRHDRHACGHGLGRRARHGRRAAVRRLRCRRCTGGGRSTRRPDRRRSSSTRGDVPCGRGRTAPRYRSPPRRRTRRPSPAATGPAGRRSAAAGCPTARSARPRPLRRAGELPVRRHRHRVVERELERQVLHLAAHAPRAARRWPARSAREDEHGVGGRRFRRELAREAHGARDLAPPRPPCRPAPSPRPAPAAAQPRAHALSRCCRRPRAPLPTPGASSACTFSHSRIAPA